MARRICLSTLLPICWLISSFSISAANSDVVLIKHGPILTLRQDIEEGVSRVSVSYSFEQCNGPCPILVVKDSGCERNIEGESNVADDGQHCVFYIFSVKLSVEGRSIFYRLAHESSEHELSVCGLSEGLIANWKRMPLLSHDYDLCAPNSESNPFISIWFAPGKQPINWYSSRSAGDILYADGEVTAAHRFEPKRFGFTSTSDKGDLFDDTSDAWGHAKHEKEREELRKDIDDFLQNNNCKK